MYKSMVTVYDGEKLVGDVEVCFDSDLMNENPKLKEKIRVSYYSTPSERCSPLAVLYTITSSRVCLKMESNKVNANSQLSILHSTCLGEKKTAVVSLDGGDELHLVALCSRRNNLFPCFWGFSVAPGLYESCLVMLNLRCLGIVFDLDETLIVANTLRSFEDKIEALQRRLSCEVDPQRIAGMLSEIKRYQDDRNILKQYAESDQVVENGKLIKAEYEVVPAISDNHQTLVRPLIRLQEKNIVLTRINPQIRDTSVLVRLRPAWEDLRSYLIARGRKRFEVYVCTMAERDYALEMWRLLDPDSNLISMKELSNRIVCVKSGLKKSLFDVFQDGNCHPKMTLVIDDRLKVWDERDQPRVHVVPAFAPYYAPQAEANSAVPILCVARNVACNVRGGFFKDFDDSLLQRINQVAYEDEIYDILPPDVSNYMVSEDDASALNGSKEPRGFDGMADVEVERRLKEAIASSTIAPVTPKLDTVLKTDFQYKSAPASMPILLQGPIVQCPNKQLLSEPLTQVTHHETSLHSSPAREEGEVPDNELDPDTRRRLLILQHGMDMRQKSTSEPPQFPVRPPPMQVSAPVVEPHGGWFPLGEDMGRRQFNRIAPSPKEPMHIDEKHTFHAPSFVPKEVLQSDDRLRSSHSPPVRPLFPGEEGSLRQLSSSIGDMNKEIGGNDTFADSPAERLHYIAFKCGTKVEFRPFLVPGIKLQFSFEVWFAGEKIGDGTGITRREALYHAAVSSLMNLADKYSSCQNSGDEGRFITERRALMREECMAFPTASVPGKLSPKKSSVDALNEQAAETAFQNLKAKIDQYPQKRQLSSRSFQGMPPTKRFRQEDPRVMQRMASARYPKNASLDP